MTRHSRDTPTLYSPVDAAPFHTTYPCASCHLHTDHLTDVWLHGGLQPVCARCEALLIEEAVQRLRQAWGLGAAEDIAP